MHSNDAGSEHEPDNHDDGGAARQASVVRQIRQEAANSQLLDYATMAPGGNEFVDGDEVLETFIDALEFPVVATNVDFSSSPFLAGKVDPWVVLDVSGEQDGIIGLVTAVQAIISAPGLSPTIERDLGAVTQKAVDTLAAVDVNKIILLNSSGFEASVEVAQQVSGVDVVVGSQGQPPTQP